MTGASASPRGSEPPRVVSSEELSAWLGRLGRCLRLIGPTGSTATAVFRKVDGPQELNLSYTHSHLPAGKQFIFLPREELLRFRLKGGRYAAQEPPFEPEAQLLVGLHPCDVHALGYLDRVFHGKDPFYTRRRESTFVLALNCREPTEWCFCASVGTGPLLEAPLGADALLTPLGDGSFIYEGFSGRLPSPRGRRLSRAWAQRKKSELQERLRGGFRRKVAPEGLDEVLLSQREHPGLVHTAEQRCLSCANCVMVCPTCFCHEVYDEPTLELSTIRRLRRWDACQAEEFSQVAGGNFRASRTARLRQFLLHKLNYTEQFGCLGTVGCGRCIRWCPTGIDITALAGAMKGP
jgi:ferredoxin